MRTIFAILLLLCSSMLVLSSQAGDKKDEPNKADEGWVQLFNGKNLDGWMLHADAPGQWRVVDGAIVCDGPKVSHLFTYRNDYENFHYRIEAWINDKGDGGQYFRTAFGSGYPNGHEAQINSTDPQDKRRTGSLILFVDVPQRLVEPETWFTQEVIAEGKHIQIFVNGKKTVDFMDEKMKYGPKGHLALQHHATRPDKGVTPPKLVETTIKVRKVEVKELPATVR